MSQPDQARLDTRSKALSFSQVLLQRGLLAIGYQISSGAPSWRGAKPSQQCLTLGQLCSWSTSNSPLTTTELHTLPLLLPCSRSKQQDKPSSGKNHPIHFDRAVLRHRMQPCSCQSATSNHLAKENILCVIQGFPNKPYAILLKEITSVIK